MSVCFCLFLSISVFFFLFLPISVNYFSSVSFCPFQSKLMSQVVLNKTGFVLNMIWFFLNMTGFVLIMTGLVLYTTEMVLNITEFDCLFNHMGPAQPGLLVSVCYLIPVGDSLFWRLKVLLKPCIFLFINNCMKKRKTNCLIWTEQSILPWCRKMSSLG